ncbi:MAG: efflux RND transporter periplasmic adaptor subunit [Halioglobus sp.]|nr:efflux RND transporter periplasmic adaptor subunit [Halioglobus sp.]
MRAYLLVALLLLLIFGAISGYLYRQFAVFSAMDPTPPPVTIGAAPADTRQWTDVLGAVGTIRAVQGVELSSRESGEVIAIAVESGDQVQAGDLLLQLNDKVELASRERQRATLELARLLYERDQKLLRQKSIPQSQYDRSKADLGSAAAQLAETEARLEDKQVRAPFDATVGIVHVKTGDYIEPGTAIATLQDLRRLEVDFTVPGRYFPQLHRGQQVRVSVDAYPQRSFGATLRAIDAQVDAGTRNLLLRARLEESSGLLPGMFAQIEVHLSAPQPRVTVPETAVTYSLHGDTVFVIEQRQGTLRVAPVIVRVGDSREGRTAIVSGLEAGSHVVIAGQNKLYPGAAVVIDESVQF